MRSPNWIIGSLLGALCLAPLTGCPEAKNPPAADSTAPVPEQPAEKSEAQLKEEFAATAKEEITADNADEVAAALEAELDAELGAD